MARYLSRLVQTLTPTPVGAALHRWFGEDARREREAYERSLPRTALAERHVEHCEVVLDRAALLRRLPRGGVVAEVGVNRGDFSAEILDATVPEALHLVDVWGSERFHDGLYDGVRSRFAREITAGQVHVHRRLSVDAASGFGDGTFDWVYIDTDHSYETTHDELRAYAAKVKPGGLIAGHDFVMGNWASGVRYGVVEAVHEFCAECGWELRYLTASIAENRSFAIQRLAMGAPAEVPIG